MSGKGLAAKYQRLADFSLGCAYPYLVLSETGAEADDKPAVPLGTGLLSPVALDECATGDVLAGSVGALEALVLWRRGVAVYVYLQTKPVFY